MEIKVKASIFLKLIFLLLSLWFSRSKPMGLFDNLNILDKLAKIFPLPQPISRILEFLSSFICFIMKVLNASMYFFDESQVLLSQFFNGNIYEVINFFLYMSALIEIKIIKKISGIHTKLISFQLNFKIE